MCAIERGISYEEQRKGKLEERYTEIAIICSRTKFFIKTSSEGNRAILNGEEWSCSPLTLLPTLG